MSGRKFTNQLLRIIAYYFLEIKKTIFNDDLSTFYEFPQEEKINEIVQIVEKRYKCLVRSFNSSYFRERVSLVEKEKELRRPRKFVYVNLALETRVDGVTDSCKRR